MSQQIKFKKHIILKRIIFIIMLIATFCIIFNFSAQDGETSGGISEKVTKVIVEIISKIKTINMEQKLQYIEKLHPTIRKLAHFSIYTVVGFSLMGLMCTFNMKNTFKYIISIVTGIGYAITDEIHQGFTPGRNPSIVDVGIDSAGVLTGIFILVILILFTENLIKLKKDKRKI